MSKNFQTIEKFRRPEIFLSELINKSVRGELWDKDENVQVWWRALVVAVDVQGGLLENPEGAGGLTHVIDGKELDVPANVGPLNPRNSIKARIITAGLDQYDDDESLRVFWPMFPDHDAMPIKPGEHVYITFEDTDFQHGLWFGKVPGHQNVNYFRGQDSFEASDRQRLAPLYADSAELTEDGGALTTDRAAGERLVSDRLTKVLGGST